MDVAKGTVVTNQECLNEWIKTIPVSEREISKLGEFFDLREKERDLEFEQYVDEISREVAERLEGDWSTLSKKEIVSDLMLAFGLNHYRVRLTNNVIQSLRREIANGNP